MEIKNILLKYYVTIIVLIIGIVFGSFLMFSSFDSTPQTIQISTKAWSDFASHVPLIRSFSLGENFPPEYPLFPGEPIKYHFLFYALVGYLEKIGVPIGLALNIPSVLGFTFLILMIYLFAKLIFKSRAVGFMAVVFFLFNSSLSFIYYIKGSSFSIQSILQIPAVTEFQSFAPYGDGIISAFWNLNIYTNQRHLALSFALSLLIIYLFIRPVLGNYKQRVKFSAVLGIVLCLSFFLHIAVFMMSVIVIFFLAVGFSKIRKNSIVGLFIAGLIALPQYLYLTASSGFNPRLVFGFLTSNNFTIYNFSEFWLYNLGLSLILIPLGFIFANRAQKKILLAFFSLFLIGNVVQFSPEIAANHKFFNYFLIIGNMFSAYCLFRLWNKNVIFKLITIVALFFMVFGGIIDFFPIYNDKKIELEDYRQNENSLWIKNNTDPNSIFLNTTFLYNPASLVGRKLFLGWPYFAWSQGYNTNRRGGTMKQMLGAADKQVACKLLAQNNIDYVEIKIQNPPDPNVPPISQIYEQRFYKVFQNSIKNYSIYDVKRSCNTY